MSEINLLPKKKYDLTRSKNIFLISKVTSIVLLLLLALFSMVLFILRLQSPLTSLKTEENVIMASMDSIKEKSIKNFIIHDRLLNISQIFSKRLAYSELVDQVVQKTPTNVSIISLSVDKKTMLLTASSPSLSSISTFLDNMVDLAVKKNFFSRITLTNLALDNKNGKYFLSVQGGLL